MRVPVAAVLLSGALGGCSVWARYTTPPESCHNGRDDDADGLEDCDDPECSCEDKVRYCRDFVDNDHDGALDLEETICWKVGDVIAPLHAHQPDPRASRVCSSDLETTLELGPEDWTWSAGPLGPGELRLSGGEQCSGLGVVTDTCQYLHALRPVSGGACWSVSVELRFPEEQTLSELDVVLGPALDPDHAPLGAAPSTAFGVRRIPAEDGARLELRALSSVLDEEGRRRVELARDSAVAPPTGSLRLTVGTGEADCDFDRISVELVAADGSRIAALDPDEVVRPLEWTEAGVLDVGVQTAAQGAVVLESLAVRRARHDPCGFPVPQITGAAPGDDTAFAMVLAAARGGGRICAIGATPSEPTVEREFVPHRDQGSLPELGPGDPAPPSQPFASWRTRDLGLDSFGLDEAGLPAAVEGPLPAPDFHWANVRAAALAWHPDIGFEGILLVSNSPRAGGILVRARSDDCEDWRFDPIDSLDGIGTLHPLLYEIDPVTLERRLVLAEPAEGYHGDRDPIYTCEPQPWADFIRGPDAVPVLKARGSECIPYPRAGLHEATSAEGDTWSRGAEEVAALPALEGRWAVLCGCAGDLENLPERTYPAPVTQLLERGGFRAFMASGRLGVEVVVDDDPDGGIDFEGKLDGKPLQGPLLVPTRLPGTFDEAVVRDGHLLILDTASPGEVEALLFYRGFRRVLRGGGEGELLRYEGGAVGVVPVRFMRPGSDGRDTGAAPAE